MSRKTAFISSVDTYFHVYNRGAARGAIFSEVRHYEDFIARMAKGIDTEVLEITAFCLMPNHYHFILFQKQPHAIPAFIRSVCEGYSKSINREWSRTGHLFEGRYRIKPVNSDEYLLHLARYIHRNPVRAALVQKAEEWPHSNYLCCTTEKDDGVTCPGIIYRLAGGAKQYHEFVEEYVDADRKKVTGMLF